MARTIPPKVGYSSRHFQYLAHSHSSNNTLSCLLVDLGLFKEADNEPLISETAGSPLNPKCEF